jgi:hypothetical protein
MEALVGIDTVSAPLAAGQSAGQFRISICTSDGTVLKCHMMDSPAPGVNEDGTANDTPKIEITFEGVDPGDYIITAGRIDQNGALIGTEVSKTFNIAATEAGTVQVPASISIMMK